MIFVMVKTPELSQVVYFSCLLSLLALKPIIDYKYPKRQDLFKEMHDLSLQQKDLMLKFEQMETDITALKFGAFKK